MDWLDDKGWFAVAVALYGACTLYSVFVWKRGFQRDRWTVSLLLSLAFVPHTISLLQRTHSLGAFPGTSIFGACLFVLWAMTAISLLLDLWPRLDFSGAFASPLLFGFGLFALMPGLDQSSDQLASGLVGLHAALILLAYGAFGLGAIAGAMLLTQEHDLKFNKRRAFISGLPAIQRLDWTGGTLLLAGTLLLTAGLGLTPWIYRDPANAFEWDIKILWSGLVWLVYASLATARWRFQFQGHRFAMVSLLAFSFVLLTFWGTNLLSGTHHPPQQTEPPPLSAGR